MTSLGQSTVTDILDSPSDSSPYNSRHTSLSISGGSNLQHLTMNAIKRVESSYQVPGAYVRISRGPTSCVLTHTPINLHSEVGSVGGSMSSVSGGAGLPKCGAGHRLIGGLTKSTLADLEKKLAELRNYDVADETKCGIPAHDAKNTKIPGYQCNARKVSRFSVSKVQEQKGAGGRSSGNSTAVLTTAPIGTNTQKLHIALQTFAQQSVGQNKGCLVNSPTEATHIPGQYVAITGGLSSDINIVNSCQHQQQNLTHLQHAKPLQSCTNQQIPNQILHTQQFSKQLLLEKHAATPTLRPPQHAHSSFSPIQSSPLNQNMAPQQVPLIVQKQQIPPQQIVKHSHAQIQTHPSQLSQVSSNQPKPDQLAGTKQQAQNHQVQNIQQSQNQQKNQNKLHLQNQQVQSQQQFRNEEQQVQNQQKAQNHLLPALIPRQQQPPNSMQQATQTQMVPQQPQSSVYSGGKDIWYCQVTDAPVLMPASTEGLLSLAASHPQLLPSAIQSDIKHNLNLLVNQLCNLRLRTNQHRRLLLLRQRQLIEEDELRLKHYVQFEKFQKALRQSGEDQQHHNMDLSIFELETSCPNFMV